MFLIFILKFQNRIRNFQNIENWFAKFLTFRIRIIPTCTPIYKLRRTLIFVNHSLQHSPHHLPFRRKITIISKTYWDNLTKKKKRKKGITWRAEAQQETNLGLETQLKRGRISVWGPNNLMSKTPSLASVSKQKCPVSKTRALKLETPKAA